MKKLFAGTAAVLFAGFIGGCNAFGFLDRQPESVPTLVAVSSLSARPVDGDGPWLFTDPPLPTYEDKTPRPRPSQSEWSIPDCVDWHWQVDPYPGVEALIRMSSVIVLATFDGYGNARWNTPTGDRPSTDEFVDSEYGITIVRDVRFDIQTFVRGDPSDLDGAFVRGGQLGCDNVSYSDLPELETGTHAVFFLTATPVGQPDSDVLPQLLRAWSVDADGDITTDAGAVITLAELNALVESTPLTPSDPMGTSDKSSPAPSGRD